MPAYSRPVRIAIVGVGAVGGYFGGRLARAGHPAAFLARGETLAALRRAGLWVETEEETFRVVPELATDDPAEIGPVELVIVGVKAWQVPEVAPRLRPLVSDGTAVLPLQNGVEAADQLAAALGPGPVLGGLCKIISMQVAPGRVRHLGVEPLVAFGEIGRPSGDRVRRLRRAFEAAGVRTETPDDIRAAIWEKFLFICPVSGVGALSGEPLGAFREAPEPRRMLRRAMLEIVAVARGHGVELRDDIVERTLAFVDRLPADGTASMQRDLAEGRPSELDSQVGAVVRLGRAVGIETPVNRAIYDRLLPRERKNRARSAGDAGG